MFGRGTDHYRAAVQIRTGRKVGGGLTSAMSIVRDDPDQRQTRADRMREEFREARARRLANAALLPGGDQRSSSGRAARGPVPADDSRVNCYTNCFRAAMTDWTNLLEWLRMRGPHRAPVHRAHRKFSPSSRAHRAFRASIWRSTPTWKIAMPRSSCSRLSRSRRCSDSRCRRPQEPSPNGGRLPWIRSVIVQRGPEPGEPRHPIWPPGVSGSSGRWTASRFPWRSEHYGLFSSVQRGRAAPATIGLRSSTGLRPPGFRLSAASVACRRTANHRRTLNEFDPHRASDHTGGTR